MIFSPSDARRMDKRGRWLSSFTSLNEREIPLTFLLVAAIYLGQQIYEGITAHDNISNLGHIIGGVIGAVVGFVLNRKTVRGRRR